MRPCEKHWNTWAIRAGPSANGDLRKERQGTHSCHFCRNLPTIQMTNRIIAKIHRIWRKKPVMTKATRGTIQMMRRRMAMRGKRFMVKDSIAFMKKHPEVYWELRGVFLLR